MTKSNVLPVWLRGFSRVMRSIRDRLGWRAFVFVALSIMLAFSALIIALELTPSHWLFDTTFVATLETQNLNLRLGTSNFVISDIAADRIEMIDRRVLQEDAPPPLLDLTQFLGADLEAGERERVYRRFSETAYLELDALLIPAGRVVELSTSGQGSTLNVQVPEGNAGLSEVSVVWSGDVQTEVSRFGADDGIENERWFAHSPSIQLMAPQIDGPISVPVTVVGLGTERMQLSGADPITTSALIEGELQFYFRNQPSQPIPLRTGQFLRFTALDAQISNLELSDRGIRLVLVGRADSIHTGYQSNLRDVTPTLLEGFQSSRSLVIIVTSGFTFLLAFLSALGLRREN
jgi:hypothetical protein